MPPSQSRRHLVDTLRQVTDALDDAIKCVVNGGTGWTQADYDTWDRARGAGEEAMVLSRDAVIMDRIDEWHHTPENGDVALHEWLGWSWDEYKRWVEASELPTKREGAF
jgi:hypothetical protein